MEIIGQLLGDGLMSSLKYHYFLRLKIIFWITVASLGAVPTGSGWAHEVPLGDSPVWGAQEIGGTRAIAWGDVDGDGDLDLACIFSLSENALFINNDGMLESTPSWVSDELRWVFPVSVAWGDVDGDGDGRRVASGLYFARLTTDQGYVETRKLVLVK